MQVQVNSHKDLPERWVPSSFFDDAAAPAHYVSDHDVVLTC